jgi:hypothetical protein
VRTSESEDQTIGLIAMQSQQFKEGGKIGWVDQFKCAYSVFGKSQRILWAKKGLASLQGLVIIGFSTWARTRDLRINRKQLIRTMLVLCGL